MKLIATVEGLSVRDKVTRAPDQGRALLELSLEGVVGDVHYGFTRPADSRDPGVERGTAVRNWRQWSAVSVEELKVIADRMGLELVDPCLLSSNLTFSGVPNFTRLPRGSEIRFHDGAVLSVEEENAPCIGPGKEIASRFPEKTAHEFVKAAHHLRGIVGVIYKAGVVRVGDHAEVIVYEPRTYSIAKI